MGAALLGVGVCYDLFDAGLANILGVETLNHGTNGINYLNMQVFGGDPTQGGKPSGSTDNWCGDDTKNFFYMFKDTEYAGDFRPTRTVDKIVAHPFIGKRTLPRLHSFLSGYNFNARLIPQGEFFRYPKIFFGTVGGLSNLFFVPTLHFHFREIDARRLDNDPYYNGIAYRTTEKVEAWRLGIMGSLLTGVNLNWFSRVKANPLKIATGIVQMTCAVALTALMATQTLQIATAIAVGILAAKCLTEATIVAALIFN